MDDERLRHDVLDCHPRIEGRQRILKHHLKVLALLADDLEFLRRKVAAHEKHRSGRGLEESQQQPS